MAKDKKKSIFNIAVVGLSGSEQVKGTSGVGKSCLCNRFIREEADNYFPDHTSVLSQSDFSGRIVNNDHFLYWGKAIKKDDAGELTFHVVEQTEFIDDQSYRPHRSSSNQNYFKRCCQTKVSSAEKLMYICTDQLGLECDFDMVLMPEGKLHIDGFIVCFDVSLNSTRVIEDQTNFVQSCLSNLCKTKKPIVMALTKCDELNVRAVEAANKLAASHGGKKTGAIHVIETSASENVNVTSAFLTLAQIIDKARTKSKIVQFKAAAEERKKILEAAKTELQMVMREHVKDYRDSWQKSRKNIEEKQEYIKFVNLEGKNAASNIFRKHVNALRDELRYQLQSSYFRFLPLALEKTLPDVSSLRSTWTETLHVIRKSEDFDSWFIMLKSNGCEWYEHEHMQLMLDRRIPYNLLSTTEGEKAFEKHKKELEERQRKEQLKTRFKHMLSNAHEVVPGGEWSEVRKTLPKHDEAIAELPESDLTTIYNQYQCEIKSQAKSAFVDLLYEKSEIFTKNLPQPELHRILEEDERYGEMDLMRADRDLLISQHASEMSHPTHDDWGHTCLDHLMRKLNMTSGDDVISTSSSLNSSCNTTASSLDLTPWKLKPDSHEFNLVLLGSDELSHQLHKQIQSLLRHGEYRLDGGEEEGGGGEVRSWSVNLRVVYGNVCLPNNSLQTASFLPNACIAVYSSMRSLSYIISSLENTVISKNSSPPQFYGLPVVIMLAKPFMHEFQLPQLREEGEKLAGRVGCPFIDASSNAISNTKLLNEMMDNFLSKSPDWKDDVYTSSTSMTSHEKQASAPPQPDLNIMMCTEKDDLASVEIALSPILNHSSFSTATSSSGVGDDEGDDHSHRDSQVEIQTHLSYQRRRIRITVSSYQNARSILNSDGRARPIIHGFILVYSTTKRSYEVMKVFCEQSPRSIPKLVLCVTPSSGSGEDSKSKFYSDIHVRTLTAEGLEFSERVRAKFIQASARNLKGTEFYRTFFTDAWTNKTKTEAAILENQKQKQLLNKIDEDDNEVEDVTSSNDKSPPPKPPPRPSKLVLNKSSSLDDISSNKQLAVTYMDSSSPQPTRQSVDNSFASSRRGNHDNANPTRDTPSPSVLSESDAYHSTPRTSPTASLIDNEMETSGRASPPTTSWRGGGGRSSPPHIVDVKPSRKSMASHVGKLNPKLINMVESSIKLGITPSSGQGGGGGEEQAPNVAKQQQRPIRGAYVLPPPTTFTAKTPHSEHKTFADGDCGDKRTSATKNNSKISSPVSTTRPLLLQPSQSCTSVNDEMQQLNNSGSSRSQKKLFASSQDDLRPLPFGLMRNVVGMGASSVENGGVNKKEEKVKTHKNKEDEKRRKEEKKKERESKRVRTKNQPKLNPIGKLQASSYTGYFMLKLEEQIQGLNKMIPLFVEKSALYVEATGIKSEGIYRKSANAKERDIFLQQYDEENTMDFESNAKLNEHTIAGALKWFFSSKNMNQPLIPHIYHDQLSDCLETPDPVEQLASLRETYRKLSYVSYSTFKFLCQHLNHITKYEHWNKMNATNLAVCWWPTLFHPDDSSFMMKTHTKEALQITIVNYDKIFLL